MPLGKNIRYRVKQTAKGPVRLAFRGNRVVEAKNLRTGKIHTPGEFIAAERKKMGRRKKRRLIAAIRRPR